MAKINKIKTIAFAKFFDEIHENYRKIPMILKDKRLTSQEKKILQAWGYLRKSQFKKVFEICNHLDTQYDDFVNVQKYLLIGLALNNSGHSLAALSLIKNSINDLLKYDKLGNIYFIALYNYFICGLNLNLLSDMDIALKQMEEFEGKNTRQEIYFRYCLLSRAILTKQEELVLKEIQYIEKNLKYLSEAVFMSYQISKFKFYISLNHYDECYRILNHIKKKRSFYNQSNYVFMKTLLDNIVFQKPIYVYENDFVGNEFLYFQLMCLKKLEEDHRQDAIFYWNKLKSFAPEHYLDIFQYKGSSQLFEIVLKKYQTKPKELNIDLSSLSKEEALLSILEKAQGQVAVERIYQLIWKTELLNKEDINKLKKLVSRLRKNKNIDIQYRKGCYSLKSKQAA